MSYLVRLSNPALNEIAEERRRIEVELLAKELEFFAEQVVKECILTVLEQKPDDGSTKVYNDLAKVLADKFGIKL